MDYNGLGELLINAYNFVKTPIDYTSNLLSNFCKPSWVAITKDGREINTYDFLESDINVKNYLVMERGGMINISPQEFERKDKKKKKKRKKKEGKKFKSHKKKGK